MSAFYTQQPGMSIGIILTGIILTMRSLNLLLAMRKTKRLARHQKQVAKIVTVGSTFPFIVQSRPRAKGGVEFLPDGF